MTDRGEQSGGSGDRPAETTDGSPRFVNSAGKQSLRGDKESAIDPTVAAATREELRTTFDYQVERLREIDTKAIEILKANLLLIGILVTGGTILVQTDLQVAAFINPFTITGGILLLASTGLAAVTYTASDIRGGLDPEAVEVAIADFARARVDQGGADQGPDPRAVVDGNEEPRQQFEERLIRSYAEWIDYNARVTAVNDLLATVMVISVFVAFVYVLAGGVVAAADLGAAASWATFFGLTAAVGVFAWVVVHMDHLDAAPDRPTATFEGIRISKGRTRRDGSASIRRMLDPTRKEEREKGEEISRRDR